MLGDIHDVPPTQYAFNDDQGSSAWASGADITAEANSDIISERPACWVNTISTLGRGVPLTLAENFSENKRRWLWITDVTNGICSARLRW